MASFLLGALGSGHHLHLPGLHLPGLHVGDAVHHGGGTAGHDGGVHGASISPFNLSTVTAFLAWFGGAGYLLTRYSGLAAIVITLAATAVGTVGGAIVSLALTRLIAPRLIEMRPEDYRVEGAVARITSPIRAGGTGEIVYLLGGTQHVEGARSVTGEALERDAEVVIHRVEGGIAYVERWEKFAERNALPPGSSGAA